MICKENEQKMRLDAINRYNSNYTCVCFGVNIRVICLFETCNLLTGTLTYLTAVVKVYRQCSGRYGYKAETEGKRHVRRHIRLYGDDQQSQRTYWYVNSFHLLPSSLFTFTFFLILYLCIGAILNI